jgi:hypothetical protein
MATKPGTAPAGPGPAPKVPETSVLVFCWIGIVLAAGTSVTFNIHHDTSWLTNALAGIAGFTPPALAAVLAHVASAFKDLVLKIAVFVVCGGAMAVSAIGTTKTLEPGYTFFGGLGFSFVTDSASMLCLWGLIAIYSARAEHSRWLRAQGAGTGDQAQNQSAPERREPVLEPAAGTSRPEPAREPGTRTAISEPAAGAGAEDAAAAPVSPAASSRTAAAGTAVAKTAAAMAADAGERGSAGEDRAAVVAEIATRPRPLEDTGAQQQRALAILREFALRTGRRMNNAELGKALGISKSDACSVRQAVAGREAA